MENLVLGFGDLILSFFRYFFWIVHHYNFLVLLLFVIIIISLLRFIGLGFNTLRLFILWKKTGNAPRYKNICYELFQDTLRGIFWTACFSTIFFSITFWF